MKSKKALLVFLIVILICAILCSCATQPSGSVPEEPDSSSDILQGEVSIYTRKNDATIANAIRIMESTHPEVEIQHKELDPTNYAEVLAVELMAGKGPDVVLFDNATFQDPQKVVDAGALLDLSDSFASDPEFDAAQYGSMLDIGRNTEGIWYVPLSYSSYYLATSDESLQKYGLTLPNDMDFVSYSNALIEWAKQSEPDTVEHLFYGNGWYMENFLFPSGLTFIDFAQEKVIPDSQLLEQITMFYQVFSPYILPEMHIDSYESGEYALPVENGQAALSCISLQGIYEEYAGSVARNSELRFIPYPCSTNTQSVGYGTSYAAIRANSQNTENAYAFIKVLLSPAVQNSIAQETPVLQSAVWSQIEKADEKYHNVLTDAQKDELFTLVTDVVPVSLSQQQWGLYFTHMAPYWEGNASYNDCVTQFENTLELYMYE